VLCSGNVVENQFEVYENAIVVEYYIQKLIMSIMALIGKVLDSV